MKTDLVGSHDSLVIARQIASSVERCPACENDAYVATINNADAGFRLMALQCEICSEDIIAAYDRIAPSSRIADGPTAASRVMGVLIGVGVAACVCLAGWWFAST